MTMSNHFILKENVPTMSLAADGELKAPPGMFRVVGVDTWSGPFADSLIGDFPSLDEAVETAKKLKPNDDFRVYIYDDTGKWLDF
jgi:hypothetical protein